MHFYNACTKISIEERNEIFAYRRPILNGVHNFDIFSWESPRHVIIIHQIFAYKIAIIKVLKSIL